MKQLLRCASLFFAVVLIAASLAACGGGGGGGGTNAPAAYTVTYNGNGNISGTVPIDTLTYQQGYQITALGNTGSLVNTGYSFSGWTTQANGSGTTYAQAQTFTMGAANVTLYAKWTANSTPTYTIIYNGNGNTGGSVPIDTTNYVQGQTVTALREGSLVNAGYSFSGWNTQADGSGTTYAGAQTFTMGTANVTLYAKWTLGSAFTVTYNGNGNTNGSVPVDSATYQQGLTVTTLGNTGSLVNTGYSFAGWNTQADGSGTTYTQGQTFAMGSANVTLYAKWTANSQRPPSSAHNRNYVSNCGLKKHRRLILRRGYRRGRLRNLQRRHERSHHHSDNLYLIRRKRRCNL